MGSWPDTNDTMCKLYFSGVIPISSQIADPVRCRSRLGWIIDVGLSELTTSTFLPYFVRFLKENTAVRFSKIRVFFFFFFLYLRVKVIKFTHITVEPRAIKSVRI